MLRTLNFCPRTPLSKQLSNALQLTQNGSLLCYPFFQSRSPRRAVSRRFASRRVGLRRGGARRVGSRRVMLHHVTVTLHIAHTTHIAHDPYCTLRISHITHIAHYAYRTLHIALYAKVDADVCVCALSDPRTCIAHVHCTHHTTTPVLLGTRVAFSKTIDGGAIEQQFSD